MALLTTTTQQFCVLEDDMMHSGICHTTAMCQSNCADQEKVSKCMVLARHLNMALGARHKADLHDHCRKTSTQRQAVLLQWKASCAGEFC